MNGMAYGGEAIGRLPDGRAAFVPLALPGEKVRAAVVEDKRGFARLRLLEVLEPSPRRVAPTCPHFGECGGCHYQHLPYEDQAAVKTEIVRDQLRRIAGLEDPPVANTMPNLFPYNYRNHIQFHLDSQGQLGFKRQRSDEVLAVRECYLPEGPLNEIWPQLDFEAMPEIERVGLRLGAGDEVQMILESRGVELPDLSIEEMPLSVVHLSPTGGVVLAGSNHLVMEVLERPFRVSAGAFFQVNTVMAAMMLAHLLNELKKRAALGPQATVLDVYCGVGLFSAFLAPLCGQLVGIEASLAACDDFMVNLDEFDHVELYEAPAEQVLPALEIQPAAVVVDPPREGLLPAALDGIVRLAPPVLAYVSCDPATLARDAGRLAAAGYRLEQTTPFDLFPQTYHIETISFFSR